MAFKMRINFVDVIVSNTLENIVVNNQPIGFKFDIRLSDYRGMYLSCIKAMKLVVDGKSYDPSLVRLCVNNKEFIESQLPSLTSEYWHLLDQATIKVIDLEGLNKGKHTIDLTLDFRVPYLPLPTAKGEYMTLDSSGQKEMEIH